jgi:hypothetical protein
MSQPWTHVPHSPAYPRVNEHYVEPSWCSERLFDEEKFVGKIYDPCCGFGRIVVSALQAGYRAYGSDKVDRGWDSTPQDFLKHQSMHDNLVFNPPFDIIEDFVSHAVALARRKVACVFPTARLNAARWLDNMPLTRVWLMTPRPSMPPGHVIQAGGKVGGGKSDYCWLVFDMEAGGPAEMKWLRRDKTS